MKRFDIYMALILVVIFTACDIPIELDPEQTESIPVIEGLVTNTEGKSYVRITETVGFYFEGNIPYRDDALVSVTDDSGNVTLFQPYTGSMTDSLGYFLPPDGFKGETGRNYTLQVLLDGETFTASETMAPVSPIDSLATSIDVAESFDPEEEDRFWEVLLYAREPELTKDFYLFKFYRNDTLERAFENDIYIVDDLFLAVNINGIPVPFYFVEGDTAVVEMYGISNKAFVYFSDLQIALANDGGLFSPPPANPRTNFDRYTPGYFLVASVATDSIIIQE